MGLSRLPTDVLRLELSATKRDANRVGLWLRPKGANLRAGLCLPSNSAA